MGLCHPVPDGGRVGQHLAAAFQCLLLAGGQSGFFDLLHLIAQQVDPSLLFRLVGDHGVQFLLDLDQAPVQHIILLIEFGVLRIIVQNAQMVCRIQQSHRVVLAVDVDQTSAQLPQHSRRGGHAVDSAAALSFGGDLTAQKQLCRALITGRFQFVQHHIRDLRKRRTDHRFGRTRAHKILGSPIAQDRIDGVDQNGLARTSLTGEDVQPRLKMNFCLLDDRDIFNLQAA